MLIRLKDAQDMVDSIDQKLRNDLCRMLNESKLNYGPCAITMLSLVVEGYVYMAQEKGNDPRVSCTLYTDFMKLLTELFISGAFEVTDDANLH